VQQQWGRLDLLVNNAGMAPRRRADLLEMGEASYDEVMATNLKGPFFLTQQAAIWMTELKKKALPPTRSSTLPIGADTASLNRSEYCLSKAAMMMTLSRLAEQASTCWCPGIIATDMTAAVQEKYDRMIAGGLLPLSRWGQPEDVAKAVLALAQGVLPYSTGEVIYVDGGFHLRRL
jgi:NAD(P)-dependent dehydrogenase (short-subunit alcohol dehydrogenase family)